MPPLGEAKKAKQYYAWSNFLPLGDRKAIKTGDKVDPGMLGLDLKNEDDASQWEEWVKGGTVRTTPYPEIPDHIAPTDHYKAMAAAAAEGNFEAEVDSGDED